MVETTAPASQLKSTRLLASSTAPSLASTSQGRLANQETYTLAAIDVGTNSIHMVVVKIQPALPTFTIVEKAKDTVRLGDFHEKTGNLTRNAIQRAIAALKRSLKIAESCQADDVVAVATSAVREAKNGQAFLEQVKKEVGLSINLISGTEEARRIYLGVLSGVELHSQPHVIVDIGGGSTELILGTGGPHRFLSSSKVGAVRLTAQLVSSDPLKDSEYNYLRAYVHGMLEPTIDELKGQLEPGETLQLIGTSGTIESLGMLIAVEQLGYEPDPLNGYCFTAKDLNRWVDRLRQIDYKERLALADMSPRRAEIIVAGAVILQVAMQLLGVESVTICERALREGVVVDWMLTHGLIEDRMQFQQSVRDRSVFKTAHKYQVDLPHAEQIAKFAVQLFDQTQGILHDWGDLQREHLWAAAILHNSGHFVSHSSHHKHSYYLIRHGELLGFTETEVEIIANLARYHRRSQPKKKHESYSNLLTKQDRKLVDQLSAILRLAVAMDRRRIGAIATFQSSYDKKSKRFTITLTPTNANDNCDLELWNLDYKKACFEEIFDVTLEGQLAAAS